MRTAFAPAPAIAAAPASADTLPVRQGFYAGADRGCATGGDPARHATLPHVDRERVSDIAYAWRLANLRENGAPLVNRLSRNLAESAETPLSRVVRPLAPGRFVLRRMEAGVEWPAQRGWCGEAIP